MSSRSFIADVGRRFAEERDRLDRTQASLAKELGLTREAVGKYERGVNWPGGEVLFSFSQRGADVRYIVTGERAARGPALPDFMMVPRYDLSASAGHGALIASEQIVDYLAFKSEWVRNALGIAQKDLALISVKGDSMQPTLTDGDLVLIDISRKMVEDSGVYVIHLSDTLMVKRVQRHLDGTLTVTSDNTKYSPERVQSKDGKLFHVVGRVVWTGRRL